uniref:Uncharacterized protein n=1 Tax=Meloidogyne enterolobii TaxID=390850 RepID=A0A6V7V155_MELEN|nr:unnamed protein product [Meloidogyne enterolobii]
MHIYNSNNNIANNQKGKKKFFLLYLEEVLYYILSFLPRWLKIENLFFGSPQM